MVSGGTGYTGIFHVNQFGNNPSKPIGDVDAHIPELLGCGRYKIHFTQGLTGFDIWLDLTDAKWATATSFRNILFDVPTFGTSPNVRVFISVDSPMSPDLIDCGYYGPDQQQGDEAKYWYLVRNHGTAYNYARDLNGFNIDPSYTGPDPSGDQNTGEIPYGIVQATSDVNLSIEDDIVIPAGKEWIVTTDPDGINNPYYEQTFVIFNSGKGLTVEDGGKLTTMNSGAFGVVDFFPSSSTVGDWTGIVAEPGSEVSLSAATIRRAIVGLTLNDPADANLSVCLIERSRDIGLHIKNCSTYSNGPSIMICSIDSTGDFSGTFRTRNVLIEDCDDAPYFYLTGMHHAIKDYDGRLRYFGGHGVEIVESQEVLFEACTMQANDSTGIFIHNTLGPKIFDCNIFSNGKNLSGQGGQVGGGIYIREPYSWTTLQQSRVYSNNSHGIMLHGTTQDTALIRGWYHANVSIDPNVPTDVDQITDRTGANCIYDNTNNIGSRQYGRFDLGSAYFNGMGDIVTLGGYNVIVNPVMQQGTLDLYSYGGFRQVWWNGNMQIWTYNGSTLDNADELQGDLVGCFEMGKRGIAASGNLTREILEYRRTRGNVCQQRRVEADNLQSVQGNLTCSLVSIYPNPFNPQTQISVDLSKGQTIHLSVTDVFGREVVALAGGYFEAGRYRFTFDAGLLASGSYIAVLRGETDTVSKLLLLTR